MNYDVIVVGSGLAGLYATLNLSKDLKILLITKRDMLLNNSALAQGGIASVCDKINDNFDLHIKDTLIAGGYKNDLHHVEMLVKEGPANIKNMIENYNVDFDKNSDGSYHLTLEGGHCRHRIYHHKDCTGLEIVQKLSKAVMQLSNVTVKTFHQVENIKKVGNTFHLEVLDENGDFCYEKCHQLIMCSGGIGRVYEHTTNSAIATGDGIALSYNLGAKIKNLHLIQFHPTAFKNQDTRECFLISESVRGEGAYLLNGNKERFMQNYDERLELAPRDVVSSCIMKEAKKIGSDKFYLDITYKNAEAIKNRFPTIYEKLIEVGIDMTKDLIPVYPCHHYLMGGIDVDDNSQSSIEGLYACGECSHTGVHGNNRLASNSLLEAAVFSKHAAQHINSLPKSNDYTNYTFTPNSSTTHIPVGVRTEIREIMQSSYFVFVHKNEIEQSYKKVSDVLQMLKNGNYKIDKDYVDAVSLATVAKIVLSELLQEQGIIPQER